MVYSNGGGLDGSVAQQAHHTTLQRELNRVLEAKAFDEDASALDPPDENRPPAAAKRKAPADTSTRAAKAAKPDEGAPTEDFVVDLDGPLRRATVKVFKGKVQVDLREFYEVTD